MELNMKKSYKWPVIIIGLLVAHTLLMLTAVTIATSDRSFAVVPNYYQKAVDWDQTKAAQQASDKLGWKATLTISDAVTPKGEREVTLTIVDADGKPVEVSKAQFKYLQYAHGNEAQDTTLLARDGKLAGTLLLRYEGFHEFIITATAGDKVFVEKITQYVNRGSRQ
jgi:nitrogen fixation protein FixH